MDNIGIIFILQIIGQRGVTNEIISIFNMLLYQPIGELYYFNIPLVKYLNTGKVIEYIFRDRQQVVYTVSLYTRLCTEKVIVYIQSAVYTTSLYISDCTLYQLYQDSINRCMQSQTLVPPGWKVNLLPPGWNPSLSVSST